MSATITAEILKSILSYDKDTGVFVWLVKKARANAGSVAGCRIKSGYIQIRIDGFPYKAHRLAWLYVYGRWPAEQIDHINGVRDDNRISNLRQATADENVQNQRSAHSNSRTGILGVSLKKSSGKFLAQIKTSGSVRHIGYFECGEEAHAAYLSAKAKLHPFQTIVGDLPCPP